MYGKWALGGALAVVVGSFLPFISDHSLVEFEIIPTARLISGTYGALLAGLAYLGSTRTTGSSAYAASLFAGGALGSLGYALFITLGFAGFEEEDGAFGTTYTVTFDPNIGVVCCVVGCLICAVTAIQLLRGR